MDPIDSPEWADNPRLTAWLAGRAGDFPGWADAHEGPWDFTPASLDRLEDLVRGSFGSWEEVDAAGGEPLLAVAAWYFGEVQVRHCGAAWRCDPDAPSSSGTAAGGYPLLTVPRSALTEHEQDELEELDEIGENPTPLVDPASLIRSLFAAPDSRLRDVLRRYERFARWRRELAAGA